MSKRLLGTTHDGVRSSLHRWIVVLFFAAGTGCTPVAYLQYQGAQGWPTGSGFVLYVDEVPVYEGLPSKTYEVVGLIDVYDSKPFFLDDSTKAKVLKLLKKNKGDALVWLNDRTVTSGSCSVGAQKAQPVHINSGGSSQPELVAIRGDEHRSESYVQRLRSTLLVIKWK